MTHERSDPSPTEYARRPVLLLLLYYGVLVGLYLLLVRTSPWFAERLGGVPRPGTGTEGLDLNPRVEPITESPASALGTAILTMGGALLLVLPVVWVYTFARHKRGFQQSLAQTLVILPIVVAVVVVLVKHSVALAFSLGGIVGAVAFRHRLEDTKDAVYIFVTIAIGLAVGVQAYSVAFGASAFFNLVVIGLWLTDFARVPGELAPGIAAKRVQRVKDSVNRRTQDYVVQLDQQVLQSMTPDQLKALADRALERGQEYQESIDDEPDRPVDSFDASVIVRGRRESAAGLRATAEAILSRESKDWRLEDEGLSIDGIVTVRYRVRCRRKRPKPLLQETLRRALATLTDDVTVQ
jgi:hypothetical protein